MDLVILHAVMISQEYFKKPIFSTRSLSSELSSSTSDPSGVQHVFLPSDVCDESVQFILSWMYGEGGGDNPNNINKRNEISV